MKTDDLERVRLAAAPFRTEPARQREIHDKFGNVTAFWQRVNHLIEQPDVLAVLPIECRLLRARRVRRSQGARSKGHIVDTQ